MNRMTDGRMDGWTAVNGFVLVLSFLLVTSSAAVSAQTVAIVGGQVHTVSGAVIDDGVVVMSDGLITAVGSRAATDIPAEARRIDASGRVVTPGLIDLATQTGLLEVSSVSDTRDGSYSGDDPVRAAFRVSDAVNPNSVVIPITRSGGVTTVGSSPSGGLISGRGVVFDLWGRSIEDMVAADTAMMIGNFHGFAVNSGGGSRGGIALMLREAFDDAREYARNRSAYNAGATRDYTLSRLDLEALQPVLQGSIPLLISASRAADIDAALRIAQEYDVRLAIVGGEEAWMRAPRLAASDVAVILKPLSNLPVQFDRLGSRFDNAAILRNAGVNVIISTMDTHDARNLRYEAGNAVRHGMGRDDALDAVTLQPAKLVGISDRYGTLDSGKIANVVVWSGDPFEFSTSVEVMFIRGVEMNLADNRQAGLLERYRTLEGRPVQYRANER